MGAKIQSRNSWLDLCRAVAISLVLISHGRHYLTPSVEQAEFFRIGGFWGVELFFVLSGFLIGSIMIRSISNADSPHGWIPSFWARRWLRTVPNYFLFLGVNVALFYLAGRTSELPDLGRYIFFVQALAWPHPDFFGEAWSLAVEEVFYFAVPILVAAALFFRLRGANAVLVVAGLVFALSFLARLLSVYYADPTWDEGVRKVTLFRLDAIMVGVIVAYCFQHHAWQPRLTAAAPYLTALLVLSLLLALQSPQWLDRSLFARVWLFPVTSFGFAGLLIVGINWTLPARLGIASAAVARWSYSAYLANLPVFAVIYWAVGLGDGLLDGILRWTAFIAGTLLISAFNYRFFERGVLSLRDRMFPPSESVPQVLHAAHATK